MPIQESSISIMRKNSSTVNEHARITFIELKKKKAEPIFNAIKMWYRTYRPIKCERTGKILLLPTVEIFDSPTLQRKLAENAKPAYGDVYVRQLISIFKILSPDFSGELFKLIKGLDTMKKLYGKERLIPLLNDEELRIVYDALKLYRMDKYKIKVKVISPNTNVKKEYIIKCKDQKVMVNKNTFKELTGCNKTDPEIDVDDLIGKFDTATL